VQGFEWSSMNPLREAGGAPTRVHAWILMGTL
jgi:hypothetical protein